jgi:putative ABC transport system permease protein
MIRSYLTIALRHLSKDRFYSLINVGGLTLGIAACLVIFLFVRFELSYDRYHTNADRIFRIDWELQLGNVNTHNAAVTPPMAEALVRDFPEVEVAARMRFLGSRSFRRDGDTVIERDVVYADNDLFRIFTFQFVAGNAANALTEPHTMVISESCAARYFPGESPIGKTLLSDNKTLYTITGLIRDMPANSHFHYDVFLSMEGLEESKNGDWIGGPFNTYVLLQKGADPIAFESKLPTLVNQYIMPYASSVLGSTFIDEFQKQSGNHLTLHVRPLTDIHLHSHLRNELQGNGNIRYVYVFTTVGLFILAIACVNFMNLSTARATKRAREVGVRKAMGSSRARLTLQFLLESSILTFISFLLAVAVVDIVLPLFNAVSGLHLSIPYSSIPVVLGLLGLGVVVGLAAGLYPGFVLSSFRPIEVLKGKLPRGHQASFIHRGLVVFQFTISIFLGIATLAVFTQVKYMQGIDLGFKKEQLIRVDNVQRSPGQLSTFKNLMLQNPLIERATVSSYFPGPGSARRTPLVWRYGSSPLPETSANMEVWSVDEDYVSTMGMHIIAGRDFSRDFPSDSSAVIINEAALDQLQLEGDPIGQRLSLFALNSNGSENVNEVRSYYIIGIAKNFNFESLRQGITPLALFLEPSAGAIAFRYEIANTQEVIEALKAGWSKVAPGEPFRYTFLDDAFGSMYATEQKLGDLLIIFTILAIVIACLGLFALTAYTAAQRTKEIGIRKVLGASVNQITILLSGAFSKLIIVSFIIATPLAAWIIQWYMQQYAYKAPVSILIYCEAGLMALVIAMATMGYHCVRAARENPVNALRSE